jgi:aminopeptidase N
MVTENIPANLVTNIRITLSGFLTTMKQMIAQLTRISKKSNLILFLLLLASVLSCKTNQVTETEPQEEESLLLEEDEDLDSLAILNLIANKEKEITDYRASAKRDFDLLHTELDLAFDWEKQAVIGRAKLTLKAFFKPQKVLILDAQDFELKEINLVEKTIQTSLAYRYNEQQITIYLPKEYSRSDTIQIEFDYTAFPEKNGGGGSDAITDTKGLYFIDPLDTVPGKPTMIWTQGETEHNSKWFPTIDKPNERFTQLFKLTVPDSMISISNGELIKQEELGNGMRKDHWEMKLPHAPYLVAIAIGNFGKVEANWDDIPLGYYVEKGYEKGAAKVFKNTPEMIGFFSELLGVKYPWPKYDQIVVRDFVSGAMENTTASIFMEELRLNEREAIDSEWDYIIAHELFHQWFGDYVTSESWSNLTLNEAFANYSEFLWNEYKYGPDEAKLKLVTETETYFQESESKQVDLIRFSYEDSEDMFDSHSYSKGGVILHMLREYLGDEIFFEGLNLYLETHALQSVEVHDLRLAFEKVGGEDLNWFFNQWFLDKGHPKLMFEVDYSQPENILVSAYQLQDLDKTPLFKLPIEITWYEGEIRKTKTMMVERAFQQFALENGNPIDIVYIDEGKNLLAKITSESNPESMMKQFNQSQLGIARYEALDSLVAWEAKEELLLVIPKALEDKFWSVRESALTHLQGNPELMGSIIGLEDNVYRIAESDMRNSVKAGAIDVLTDFNPDKYNSSFLRMVNDSSYLVAGSALMGLMSASEQKVSPELVERFATEDNFRMVIPVADYFITSPVMGRGDWFQEKIEKLSGEGFYFFLGYYSEYFSRFPEEGKEGAVEYLLGIMRNDSKNFIRLGAFQALLGFADDKEIVKKITEASKYETDSDLKNYFSYFIETLKDEN